MNNKQVDGHTQGEWTFRQSRGNNKFEHEITADGGYTVARLGHEKFEKEPKTILANAKLIAAAPDMLKVLQIIRPILAGNYNDEEDDALHLLIEVIEKATK